jgi:sugar phosphate isomerase/epimerase
MPMFGPRYIYCEHSQVAESLPRIAEIGLGVEIVFETTENFWPQVRWEDLLDIADAVSDAGVEASVHGPFHNLSLGSRDAHIRSYTLDVLTVALETARAVRSPHVVFHTGYLPQYSAKARARWLETFSGGLEQLILRATDLEVQLAMENTYEPDTSLFEEILDRFPTPALGMCLDTAHATCFGQVDPAQWSRKFGDRIVHMHCSDNDGHSDQHLALGTGIVNFRALLDPLARIGNNPSVTLEVNLDDAAASRDYFETLAKTLAWQEIS